jgi:hypothetical protein
MPHPQQNGRHGDVDQGVLGPGALISIRPPPMVTQGCTPGTSHRGRVGPVVAISARPARS